MALSAAGKRCREEQRRCREWLVEHPNATEAEKRGVFLGANDWFVEELLLGEEMEADAD